MGVRRRRLWLAIMGSSGCATLLGLWVFASLWTVFYVGRGRTEFALSSGAAGLIWWNVGERPSYMKSGWVISRASQPIDWWPHNFRTRSGAHGFVFPLWLGWLGCGLFAARGWWRLTLIDHADCPTCGYDLKGLAGSQCPECGSDANVQSGPAQIAGK